MLLMMALFSHVLCVLPIRYRGGGGGGRGVIHASALERRTSLGMSAALFKSVQDNDQCPRTFVHLY